MSPTQIPPTTPPTELATQRPTPKQSPEPSASPTPTCLQPGVIEEAVVPDQGFGRELPYRIYLPPCYQELQGGLPTLYLLHGLAGDHQSWLDLGLAQTADRLMMAGELPPFLIVLPWQRTGLETEEAVIQGLLPHVEDNYRSLPGRSWRAIGGFSRGGGWAFRIGMKHPSHFYRVGLHSPGLLSGDLTSMEIWLKSNAGSQPLKIWIDIGEQDSLMPAAEELRGRLDELNLDYQFRVGPGDHDAAYWSENLADYLAWYAARW
ncbi:MAG: alpha/beta hydrolase [Anaerolineales bacterium]